MNDVELIGLYWARDERAIAATAEKYGGYCNTIAMNILGSSRDAEECVNDTYLRAWEAMPPQRPKILRAFIGRITRNLALNRYKRVRAEKRGGGGAELVLDELGELASGRQSVESEMELKELAGAVNGYLSGLTAKKRAVFLCRYWYFDSVADIAGRFGMSENSVSVTLNRLRRGLASYLTERGFDI